MGADANVESTVSCESLSTVKREDKVVGSDVKMNDGWSESQQGESDTPSDHESTTCGATTLSCQLTTPSELLRARHSHCPHSITTQSGSQHRRCLLCSCSRSRLLARDLEKPIFFLLFLFQISFSKLQSTTFSSSFCALQAWNFWL